jgi:hypothetical protein
MRQMVGFARGLILLGLMWTGGEPREAQATIYDYGVGLQQSASVNGGETSKSFSYTTPDNGSPDTGKLSLTHSQSDSVKGKNVYYPAPVTGSGTVENNAQVDMGAIHLVSSGAGTGEGSASASSQGIWSDVLTIGGPFAPGTDLKFLVTLDLTGSVSATSEKLPVGGSSSFASAQSYLSIQSGLAQTINNQHTCEGSNYGKPKDCKTSFSDFSYVLKTYSGDHVSIIDSLLTDFSSSGGFYQYSCGTGICTKYASSSADSYFLNTSLVTLTPLTAGAFYTSASGTIYSGQSGVPGGISATPEPSSLALFGTGILGLGLLARNKSWIRRAAKRV